MLYYNVDLEENMDRELSDPQTEVEHVILYEKTVEDLCEWLSGIQPFPFKIDDLLSMDQDEIDNAMLSKDLERLTYFLKHLLEVESKEDINRSMLRKVVGGSIPLIEMEKLLRPCNGKFLKQQGVGRTKRVALAIIDELYQRFHNGEYRAYQVQLKKSIEEKRNVEEYFFASPKDVKKYFEGKMRPLPIEQLKVVCFDSNKRVKHVLNYSNGQKHYSVISASTMMSIIQNSAGVLFVHNHPSGNCLPSPEDVSFTMRVLDLCKEYHCHFIDHVIIGHKEEFSFIEALKEKGWL